MRFVIFDGSAPDGGEWFGGVGRAIDVDEHLRTLAFHFLGVGIDDAMHQREALVADMHALREHHNMLVVIDGHEVISFRTCHHHIHVFPVKLFPDFVNASPKLGFDA